MKNLETRRGHDIIEYVQEYLRNTKLIILKIGSPKPDAGKLSVNFFRR
jgi:hypothetical protein